MRLHLIVLLLAPASALSGQSPRAASRAIAGIVVDSARAPVPGAEVRQIAGDTIRSLARTADDGRFVLVVAQATPASIRVRRMGFIEAAVAIPLRQSVTDTLVVVLAEVPASLAEIDVVAPEEEMAGWLREFYQRRRSNSFGRYFTRQTIQDAGKYHMSELLRMTPGVTLAPGRRFGYVVRMRGCRDAPMIWLDGSRLPGAELDDISKPADIAAMEVYTSSAGVPVQFMDRSNRGCGTILLWTRHQ